MLLERLAKRLPLLTGGPRDAPARQQTLRATIEWSHDLLSPDEQALFRRLAVFVGGCSLEAAEDVCEADLDTLQSLVEKSLARQTGERFWMLETIREFAFERLEESGDAKAVGQRHAKHFLRLAEEAALHLENPPEQRRWLELLDRELHNIRVALAWASDGAASDIALRLAASLREFWFVRGHYSEGLRWLDSLIARSVSADPRLQSRALEAACELAIKVNEVALARRYAEDGLARARAADDKAAAARSLLVLGTEARLTGNAEQRDALYSEGFTLAREAGDFVLAARFLANFGVVALEAGDFDRARGRFRDSLALSKDAGSEQGIARAHGFLAGLALHEGHVEDGVILSRRSLEIAHRLGWMEAVVYQLGCLACAYAALGQTERAAKLVGAESRLVQELDLRLERFQRELRERAAGEVRSQLDPELLNRLLAEGRAMSLDETVQCALSGDA
jgi:tetratricopeptide (TPR) repeat protein